MVKVGIIGGNYGYTHHLSAIERITGFEIVAVSRGKFKENLARRESLKRSVYFDDYEELLSKSKIDLLVIATPPATHYEIASFGISCGVKHIVCEKPCTISSSQAKTLEELARLNDCFIYVSFQFRYEPFIEELKNIIQNHKDDKILSVEVAWMTNGGLKNNDKKWRNSSEEGGGLIHDWLPHVLDYLDYILGIKLNSYQINLHTDEKGIAVIFKSNETYRENTIAVFDESSTMEQLREIRINISNFFSKKPFHRIKIKGTNCVIVSKQTSPFFIENIKIGCGAKRRIQIKKFKLNKEYLGIDSRIVSLISFYEDVYNRLKKSKSIDKIPTIHDSIEVNKEIERVLKKEI